MAYFPTDWSEYIGQAAAVRQLRIKSKAARARRKPLPHTLIHSHIPGVGKTALAMLAARQLGARIFIQTEPLKPTKVRFLFADMNDGDVLFLDEIHKQFQGGKANAEWMLHYLQRGVMPGARGEEEAPAVTIIGATTDVGKLGPMFLGRFEIQLPLEPYTDDEAAQIAAQLGRRILEEDGDGLPVPSARVCAAIARAASNNPREMERILDHVRDLVWADELEDGLADGDYDLSEALSMAGFTPDGLTIREQRYLLLLHKEFRGEAAGEAVMRQLLGEVREGVNQVEKQLADKGLITFTKGGRVLTSAGYQRARLLDAETIAA